MSIENPFSIHLQPDNKEEHITEPDSNNKEPIAEMVYRVNETIGYIDVAMHSLDKSELKALSETHLHELDELVRDLTSQ